MDGSSRSFAQGMKASQRFSASGMLSASFFSPAAPQSPGGSSSWSQGSALRLLLRAGMPVLEHKHRKAKFGSLGAKPRVLRLSPDLECLDVLTPDGDGWVLARSVLLTAITSVLTGAQSPLLVQAQAGDPARASGRDVRCFSLVMAKDNGVKTSAVQYVDLELPALFAEGHPLATPANGILPDAGLPSTSLRDVVVAELDVLRRKASARETSDFIAAAKWGGARMGFVFKRGERGVGYYRDRPAK